MIRNSDRLDNQLKILIVNNPGISFTQLKKQVDINPSTLGYRLTSLEFAGEISLEKDIEMNYGGVTKVRDIYWFTFGVKRKYRMKVLCKECTRKEQFVQDNQGADRRGRTQGLSQVRQLTGQECLVTIVHKEDARGNICENVEAVKPILH